MNSADFDQIIQRVFEATGIDSQNELAQAMKINRSAVTQARKKGRVPERWLLKLYRKFGLNPEWLESGHGRSFLKKPNSGTVSEFQKIPKVSARICAGDGSFETDDNVQCFYAFQKEKPYQINLNPQIVKEQVMMPTPDDMSGSNTSSKKLPQGHSMP